MEAAATTWGVAALAGVATFGALLVLGGWTFIQGAFAGIVVLGVLGTVLALTVGKTGPSDALPHESTTRAMGTAGGGLAIDLSAMRPRDLNKPSPHKAAVDVSMISDTDSGRGFNGPSHRQPITGTIEAEPATIVPSPAPINAGDPAVARPIGVTADPKTMLHPTPLNGQIVSPEPPQPFEGEAPGRISLNEAALAGGAPVTVGTAPAPAAESGSAAADVSPTVSSTVAASAPAAPEEAGKPMTLDAAPEGGGDDLKKIKGVGPKLEGVLNSMGFWTFDQIAAWTDKEVAWVDENLEGFRGRVSRDDWVSQAKELAGGK
ncbi:hypothetical protein [Jannaschia seohaensis]|nr:hypothetical protein [Jannaschia seohaensis]